MTTQVQAELIADGSITAAKLASNAVTTAKLASGAVTSSILASGAAAANIGSGGVTSAMLASGASLANLASASVTPAKLAQPLTLGTAVNTTSGTSIDFTGIPSWVKRITVLCNGVSKNSLGSLLFQIGTSSGVETTGYSSSGTNFVGNVTSTSGFIVADGAAAYTTYGHLVLTNISGNIWIGSFAGSIASTLFFLGAGVKTLGGTLDRLRITTSSGTDTFDAGSVNILYE